MSIQLQNFVSLTTTGTSGASTLTNGILNVPNYATGSSFVNMFMTNGDQTTTSSSAVNLTDLVTSLQANKRYYITGQLKVTPGSATGMKYQISVPTGSTLAISLFAQAGGATAFNSALIDTSGVLYGFYNTNTTLVNFVQFRGEITTGANVGNLQFAFASNGTSTSRVSQQGTYIQLITLA